MKAKILMMVLLASATTAARAAGLSENYDLPPLTAPAMEPRLVTAEDASLMEANTYHPELSLRMDDHAPWAKENWTWMRTNPDVVAYRPKDDLTYVGVPIFLAGIIAKSEKASFAQQRKHSLLTEFKTGIDDYSQYFGPAVTLGLKIGGVEGRSDWGRFLASTAMSYGIMAAVVNSIKYTAKEMRPDGSQANSWPSGHTATAFVGASILHKEYGLTRSPWFSVAGYGVATATGVMRVLNNRHWVSDILSGAGIGIMSTEVAYALSDVLFKERGLLRGDALKGRSIIDHPSFFSISMGIGFGSKNMDFDMQKLGLLMEDDGDKTFNLKFGASTAVAAEGAYFFNKYIGVGGRLRVNSSPIKGWGNIVDRGWDDLLDGLFDDTDALDVFADKATYDAMMGWESGKPIVDFGTDTDVFTIESDHLTEFSGDVGLYFNFPLSSRFALGTKLLVGRSIMQEINLKASVTGYKRDFKMDLDAEKITSVTPTDEKYTTEWDYFTVGGNDTWKYGTGISLTYAYKDNFSWKLFLDYDFSRKTYTMTYNPSEFILDAANMRELLDGENLSETQSIKKNRNTFILGGSFAINF